jgi:dinuclear metal center YbgI/SA1388 family protein
MTSRDEILAYLHDYLRVADFKDYGPQGLQVEGKPEVRKVVSGVSASVALFEEAAGRGADLVITHHGILWENESRVVKGGLKRRLELLFEHDITLAGYHLCLDAHPEVGNNVLGCRGLGLENIRPWAEYRGKSIGCRGDWPGLTIEEAARRVNALYESRALVFPSGPAEIRKVGLISGGAQGELRQAIEDGLDLFVTGEASEFVMNTAREAGIHFIAAGHYATERIGIRTLGEHLADRFKLAHEFVEVPNPV